MSTDKNDPENNESQNANDKKIITKCKHKGKHDSPLCLREGILSGDCNFSYSNCSHYEPSSSV